MTAAAEDPATLVLVTIDQGVASLVLKGALL